MGTTQFSRFSVQPDDEVVVPAYGGGEVAQAVRAAGARPVLADIDPRSLCIAPSAARDVLTSGTVAITVLPLFGHRPDVEGLHRIAEQHELKLIDCAPVADTSVSVDAHRRRRHASYLNARLTGVEVPGTLYEDSWNTYVVRVPGNGRPDRDAFKQALRARGVECWVPVKYPLHWTPGFRTSARLPEAERAANECLALPVHSGTTRRDLQRMVSACNALGGLVCEPAC